MVAPVFLYHVVGDLTLGKPELVEFHDTETVEAATRAIAGCSEGAITVWRRKAYPELQQSMAIPSKESSRDRRFVGVLHALDLVAFIAKVGDQEKAMRTPVSEVVVPNSGLLKEVDPRTRLIDALEMMKQGVRCLLVRKSTAWKGMSKRFSVIYNGKWLKNPESPLEATTNSPSSSTSTSTSSTSRENSKFCCLSREDVIRFLIGCLGALAPIPLSSISILGVVSPDYTFIDVSTPAMEAVRNPRPDTCAVAVVEKKPDGSCRITGEISSFKLWKCDHSAAGWALANLSAGQFVMGANDDNNQSPRSSASSTWAGTQAASRCGLDFSITPELEPELELEDSATTPRRRKFSSRKIGFSSTNPIPTIGGLRRSMYRGRSAPLTCKNTTSLAAVMAQMLSHRATHVWVTEADSEDVLLGIVGYTDILHAVTRHPSTVASASTSALATTLATSSES